MNDDIKSGRVGYDLRDWMRSIFFPGLVVALSVAGWLYSIIIDLKTTAATAVVTHIQILERVTILEKDLRDLRPVVAHIETVDAMIRRIMQDVVEIKEKAQDLPKGKSRQ